MMRLRCRAGLAAVALLWLAAFGDALAEQADPWPAFSEPSFRHFNQDDGLPNPAATAFAEDGDGFIWVGTEGGLARYDGYRFRSYKPAAAIPGSLPDNWVTTLHADGEGNLWVGTSSAGLARYDRADDRFVTYGARRGGLSGAHVSALADDGPAGLWIATDGGLDRLDAATGRIVAYHHVRGDRGSLPDDRILALLHARNGVLWVGTDDGVARLLPGSKHFERVFLHVKGADRVAVGSLFEDATGRVWLGTTEHGAFVISPPDMRPRPVAETSNSGLAGQWVYAIGEGERGEIWLGTYGQGIVAIAPATGRTRRIVHQPAAANSLSNDTVWAFHKDRSGGVWVGTTDGISRLETNGGAVLTISAGNGGGTRLSESDVGSLAAAADGRVWAGLFSKGIDIIDPVRARITNIAPDRSRPESALPSAFVLALLKWSNGDMFIGTTSGLYRADARGSHLRRVTVPGRPRTARVHALIRLGRTLWLGGADDGLWSFTPGVAGQRAEHLDNGALTDRRIVSLTRGAAGNLWIGTRRGLNRLDLATRAIERILPDPASATSLAAGYISTILLDRMGRPWIGTLGGGIEVLVAREHGRPVFRRVGVDQGLPDANVDGLLRDTTGKIWAATDGGIAVIDPVNFAVRALSRADGAPSSAYWVQSATALAGGDLLFGGAGTGLTVIRPDRFRVWNYRPRIVVTEVRLGGKIVSSGRFNDLGAGVNLLVPSDARSLAVEFSSLDYSAPQSNRYAYQLQGFDKDWIETDSSRRLAAYTNLPPGYYVLRLRGSNRNGVWSSATLNLPIHVLPTWYQTWWLRLIVVVLVVVCVVGLVQVRTKYLRRRQHELERQVAERTAQLEASRAQIELIANQDALTNLSNRRRFEIDIRKLTALVDRSEFHFALLLIDLDRFKDINDSLGHDFGDAILVEAARRFGLVVRVSDSVARLGGDEFAILIAQLPGTAPNDRRIVDALCRRVIDCFARPIEFQAVAMAMTASIGVALCPEHGADPEAIYKAADMALYDAKRAGRNTWRWSSSPSPQPAAGAPVA